MSFPDLSAQRDTRRASLVKVSIKRDPDGKSNDDLLYDLHLAHLISQGDPDDLARLDAQVPGASALVASGSANNRRSRISDASDQPDRWLSVQDPVSGQHLCWQRRMEVKSTAIRVVGPAATAVIVARVRGLDATDAARLARLLEREVDVTYEDMNPSLGLARPAAPGGGYAGGSAPAASAGRPMPNHRGWDGTVGCVVAGRYVAGNGQAFPMAGIVTSVNPQADGNLLHVEDVVADANVWMTAADVESTIHVVAPTGDTLPDVLARYASGAASAGVNASWTYLVTAFGIAYADGTLPASQVGEWVLSPDIAQAAIDLAASEGEQHGAQKPGLA